MPEQMYSEDEFERMGEHYERQLDRLDAENHKLRQEIAELRLELQRRDQDLVVGPND